MRAQGQVLHPGEVSAATVVLYEPLSFWGGYDPATGTVIDVSHPEVGTSVTGAVVVLPAVRGSAGTPSTLGESLRLGTGPAAIILNHPDVNVAIAAMVAESLYDVWCPVVALSSPDYETLAPGTPTTITSTGIVTQHSVT